MKFRILAIVVMAVLLSGCFGTTIKNVNEYSRKQMQAAEILPSEEQLEGRPSRVVVFDVDDQRAVLAQGTGAGVAVSGELVSQISKANARMIDKEAYSKLEQAIQQKTQPPKAKGVDYAISGKISRATFSVDFSGPKVISSGGESMTIPASCSYKAKISGNVKIYRVGDNFKVERTVAVSGKSSRSIDVILDKKDKKLNDKAEMLVTVLNALDPSLKLKAGDNESKYCNHLSKQEISSLVRSAGVDAISQTNIEFQNFFSPRGYVLEHRIRGKDNIFKVSLGKKNGVKENLKAEIYSLENQVNAITKKSDIVQNKIGEGKVSDQINKQHAWIVVDESTAKHIKLGDVVEIKYEKSFFDKIKSYLP